MLLRNLYRPLDIDLILQSYTIDDLRRVYAEALCLDMEQVYGKQNGELISLSTRQTLSPELRGELGEIGTFTVNNMLNINVTERNMSIVSFDKGACDVLFTAFGELLGIIRRKKLAMLTQ